MSGEGGRREAGEAMFGKVYGAVVPIPKPETRDAFIDNTIDETTSTFLAKASIFKLPFLGMLMRASGQVPVEREGSGRSGGDPLAMARGIAAAGHAVVIYPEGSLTRDPDSWPMRGKQGAVRAAIDAGVPLIPVASWGAQRILPRYGKFSFFPRKHVDIVFGEPLDLSEFAGKSRDLKAMAAATNKLMNAITALLEGLRNEKAPIERWDPSAHGQSEVGKFVPPAG